MKERVEIGGAGGRGWEKGWSKGGGRSEGESGGVKERGVKK